MIISRKRFEEEIARRLHEEYQWRMMRDDLDSVYKRLDKMNNELFEIRMKVDEEFRKRNTPTCEP